MAKQKKSKMALYTRQDKIILYCGYALLGLFLLAIIVPMIYIVIASFMDPVTLQNKGISFDFSVSFRTSRFGSASRTQYFTRSSSPSSRSL